MVLRFIFLLSMPLALYAHSFMDSVYCDGMAFVLCDAQAGASFGSLRPALREVGLTRRVSCTLP